HAAGPLTHIDLRPGNSGVSSTPVLTLVKAGSFYVTGYFEETNLPHIKIGDKAKIILMSGGEPFYGHVISIGKAVAD
ncbi:HlyD family secretion protein, partial [Francisella tularensis subsp. holarctica]|nr:HlyD family secretion protein [Francisella tularensis subsp. holarctica]